MTDTPRTRDELLSDFAEGQVAGITSQKMRNLIVSAPIAASRFADFGNFTIHDLSLSPVKYKPDSAVDPEGWFTDEADYTSGFLPHAVPQGGLMRLPPGWYDAFLYQSWAGSSLASGADYGLSLVHADDPGPLDDIFGGDQYSSFGVGVLNVPPPNAGFKNVTSYSTIRVPSKMLDDTPVTTWPVAAAVFLNHQGEDVTGSFGQILIRRIGVA